jgi:cell division protein FtsB
VLSKQNRKMHIKHLKLKSLVRYFAKHLWFLKKYFA